MSEWQPIETAPKGSVKLVCAGKGMKEIHVAPRIVTFTSAGELTITYWVPEGERWSMFSHKTPPTHWLPVPDLPI
jgi:hypothetical protein